MKTSSTCVGILILLLTSPFADAHAQEPPAVKCIVRAAVEQVTFGDSLTVVCTVDAPTGLLAAEPFLETPSPSFDIQTVWHRYESLGEDGFREQYGFLIHVFALDTLFVGPFIAQVTDEAGREFLFESNTLVFPVESVLNGEETAFMPDRNPMVIPSRGIPAWVFAVMVGILTAIILLIITRKKDHPLEVLPVPEKPVDEIGVFLRIAALCLAEQDHYKELYILLSAALRGFIHRNMAFDAMYDTTDEIIRELRKSPYGADIVKTITGILQESDQVKFAKYVPSREHLSTVVERVLVPVRSVLDENRHRYEAVAAEQAHPNKKGPEPTGNREALPSSRGQEVT
ncbi:hypothetical protein ACFL55_00795 [Candidatus Latescibacterota bacterium]